MKQNYNLLTTKKYFNKRTISKKSLETSVGIFQLSVDLEGSNFGYRYLFFPLKKLYSKFAWLHG